jgi:hypothetical protein
MREFIENAPITAEQIQRCVLAFLLEHKGGVLVGAWAVNLQADSEDERMTADIDLKTKDPNLHVNLIAYVLANKGVTLKKHSEYPDLLRLYADGLNRNRPIVDIMIGDAEHELISGIPVGTVEYLIQAKEKAIASPSRPETKRLIDKRDLLVLQQKQAKAAFNEAMFNIYKRANEEAKYPATHFLQMLNEYGGLETAQRLLKTTEVSEGFTQLCLRGRMDLTVEALVLKPQFAILFGTEELEMAKNRLL